MPKLTDEMKELVERQPMTKLDFTGTWKLNHEKSSLQIPAPESTIFVIKHSEPHFHLERTHVFGGNSDTLSIDLTTDGKAQARNHGGFKIHASLPWEREEHEFHSKIHPRRGQTTDIGLHSDPHQ